MSEFKFRNRIVGAALIATVAGLAVNGCSSASQAPKPRSLPTCHAPQPDTWEPIPPNVNSPRIAERLNVDAAKLAQAGKFGMAVCEKALSVDDIGSHTPPIVNVTGVGGPCLVIGTIDAPKAGAMVTAVEAVCYTNGNPA